jgi:hypothetical protein
MKSREFRPSARAAILLLFTCCTSSVWARLYPPVQPVSFSLVTLDTIRYSVVDPISGQMREETWTIPQGVERIIESQQANQGIVTWIEKYKNLGDVYYTYSVQYRIYDPGRGGWRAGSWGPFAGYETSLGQHQVMDGVVAWTSKRRLGPNPTDELEHQVLYVTYEPGFGSWLLGYRQWRVKDLMSPEVLRVKNGIVSWPMNSAISGKCSGEVYVLIYAAIYDPELKSWREKDSPTGYGHYDFDWIEIPPGDAVVHYKFSGWWFGYTEWDDFWNYDAETHQWKPSTDQSHPYRRVYFVAWPDWGIVPFRTWFWDLSTGLEPPNASYLWNLTPADSSTERSPGFQYTTAGFFNVLQNITYINPPPLWFQSQISALAPGPTGNININNNAAYTSSYNITLSLNYEATAAEMRFKQVPGLGGIWAWTTWEPVAPTKAWTLSGIFVGDIPDGTHTVSVQYRTEWSVESEVYQDSIELDITPPAGTLTLNGGALRTNNPNVQAVWSASDFYSGMQMSYSAFNEEDGYGFWSPWESYQPANRNFTFSGIGGRKTVLVRFKDAGGNITQKEAHINMDWRVFLPLILR